MLKKRKIKKLPLKELQILEEAIFYLTDFKTNNLCGITGLKEAEKRIKKIIQKYNHD